MNTKGKFAVIGWGSLIWDPGEYPLPIVGDWELDGPMLSVEFVRKSDDGRPSTDMAFRREFEDMLLWTQRQDCIQSVIPAKAGIPLPLDSSEQEQ